jgi:radical SAM superfamily enzyme YgiQ (UPF0313 family)
MTCPGTLLIPTPAYKLRKLNPYFPIGLYSIREVARQAGLEIEILDLADRFGDREFTSATGLGDAILALFDPSGYRIFGLSTLGPTLPISVYLAAEIKRRNPKAVIVFGGPHASFLPRETLEDFPFVDAVVVGEGEITFTGMLRGFRESPGDWRGIRGVMLRNSPFQKRELINNLDTLPMLDYDVKPYLKNNKLFIRVEALRGCYAKCKFCATSQFWECRVRRKSPARLVAEMSHLAESANILTFQMVGDNFSFPLNGFRETCKSIIETGIGFEWVCALRIGDLEQDDLKLLKEAGCSYLFVGIESASQDTLNRIHKKIDLNQSLFMIEEACKMGLQVGASQIIGFPWETEQDVMATLRLHSHLLELGAFSSFVLKLAPVPGAEGFPGTPVITDLSRIEDSLPDLCKDEFSKELIKKFPRQFTQFGYYETPHLRRSFINAIVDTAEQIEIMRKRELTIHQTA